MEGTSAITIAIGSYRFITIILITVLIPAITTTVAIATVMPTEGVWIRNLVQYCAKEFQIVNSGILAFIAVVWRVAPQFTAVAITTIVAIL